MSCAPSYLQIVDYLDWVCIDFLQRIVDYMERVNIQNNINVCVYYMYKFFAKMRGFHFVLSRKRLLSGTNMFTSKSVQVIPKCRNYFFPPKTLLTITNFMDYINRSNLACKFWLDVNLTTLVQTLYIC